MQLPRHWAHGVVVSHPLCMRKALGSNPSGSIVDQACRMYIHSTPGVQIQLSHCYQFCKRIQSVASWPHGVTVSTLDSESSDRGSNPREAFACVEDQLVCEAESVFCCVLKLLMWDWLLARI